MAEQTVKEAFIKQIQVVEERSNIAQTFQDAMVLLESIARRDDFFAGYTLNEAIKERLARMGYDPARKDDESYGFPADSATNEFNDASNRFGRRIILSDLARLDTLQKTISEAVAKGVAILEGKTIKEARSASIDLKYSGVDPVDSVEVSYG